MSGQGLTEVQKKLLAAAAEAAEGSYSPYSGFPVGAAVLAGDRIFPGANVENASIGLTLCAERAALARAVQEKALPVQGVAVFCAKAGEAEEEAMPCGACLQWLLELAPDAWIVTNTSGRAFSLEELLPRPFRLKRAGAEYSPGKPGRD